MTNKLKEFIPGSSIRIGFLHPGEMGAALANVARQNGATAVWASDGRSNSTASRAAAAGMTDVGTLEALCQQSDVIVSICPPHAAVEIAEAIAALNFNGVYVDANAISPATSVQIAEIVERSGANYVDAAVVGPPPWENHGTFIYFSGNAAEFMAGYFRAKTLSAEVLGESQSQASALKICHSAVHKAHFATLLATIAAAEHYGVRGHLENLWTKLPNTNSIIHEISEIPRRAAKGWRFAGEMLEVSDAFAKAGLPPGLHQGASEVFRRCPRPGFGESGISIDHLIRMLQSHDIERK